MFRDGVLNVKAPLDTSGPTGCLPFKVFVDLDELSWFDGSNGRFLGFGKGVSGLASTRRCTADLVGDGGV
jgi:hypothetical protein